MKKLIKSLLLPCLAVMLLVVSQSVKGQIIIEPQNFNLKVDMRNYSPREQVCKMQYIWEVGSGRRTVKDLAKWSIYAYESPGMTYPPYPGMVGYFDIWKMEFSIFDFPVQAFFRVENTMFGNYKEISLPVNKGGSVDITINSYGQINIGYVQD